MTRKYYSQSGEDYLLWKLFESQEKPGFFVEVGALDGTRFSNTYSFELAGWRGICVEAHPDYIDILTKNRPGSHIFFAAAGDSRDTVTFYSNSRGSLSTLDKSLETTYATYGKYFTGFEPVEVEMRTLNDMLIEADAPVPIDIVSIDVEGAEMLVLKGFDLSHFQPRIIVIEAIDDNFEKQFDAYFVSAGYHKCRKWQDNIFYCRDEADASFLQEISIECEVIQTPHILDSKQVPVMVRISDSINTPIYTILDNSADEDVAHTGKVMNIYRKFTHFLKSQKQEARNLSAVFETGFHGDTYLNTYINQIMLHMDAFIETGTNVGTTLAYMAKNYPEIPRYSCEPDKTAYQKAQEMLSQYSDQHTNLYNMSSPEFLYHIFDEHPHLKQITNFYWLDAHGHGFQWPLADELKYITANFASGFIMVDDSEVPGQAQFIYASYDGQVCNYEYISNALSDGKEYTIIHPAYTEHTSKHHPLVGHTGIAFGDMRTKLPETTDYTYKTLSL